MDSYAIRNRGRVMKRAKNVDEYITGASKEVQPKLREIKPAIKEVAPDAVESISYGMPFYSYKGEKGKGLQGTTCLLRASQVEHCALHAPSRHRATHE